MEKKKVVILASVVAAGLLAAAPAFAEGNDATVTQMDSASNVVLSVDSYGKPSVNGEDIANLVSSEAKNDLASLTNNWVCGGNCKSY